MKKIGLLRAARLSMALSAAIAASLVTASVAQAAPIPNKTLVYCSEGSPAGFDPAQYTTGTDFTANTFTVYNRLVEFERGSTKVEGGLAEKWDVSPDGLTYTFHLRHGVKFQTTSFFKPTRDFNADDVLFTFNRMLDPDQPFRKAYPVSFPYFSDLGLAKNISKIEALDPYTVRFTLKQVDAPHLQQIAMPFAPILSAQYTDQLLKAGKASDINLFPVGTGPFIFRSYTKDDTIRFDGNPDYWKPGVVRVSKLIFAITVDPAVRLQKLKRGECQVMAYPRPADIPAVKADPSLAKKVGDELFPGDEADMIPILVGRDAPFYDATITSEAVDGLNKFAMANGLLERPLDYEQIVAAHLKEQFRCGNDFHQSTVVEDQGVAVTE